MIPMEAKIQLKHPSGKKAVSMDKEKYTLLKEIFLSLLKAEGEATQTKIVNIIKSDFKKNKTKFAGSVEWHLEWVKLDLEANKIIERVPKTSPQKYMMKKRNVSVEKQPS